MFLIKEATLLQKNRFESYYDFLLTVHEMGTDGVNSNSLTGSIVSVILHKIIQDKSVSEIPADVRVVYDPRTFHAWNSY
jgi:hypothetical protein